MAYPPLSLEEAFRQDIEALTDSEDMEFTKKHFLFQLYEKLHYFKKSNETIVI